ncbi:Gfo/Idh/MocA family oxidoreductase [Flavobacteriaceae bacterium]|nr:Gfo/Idh/MocA family oxidoreductase [Flavobacteriaceae bacterium]
MINDLLNKNILVIGSGSIGKRHIENLIKLKFNNIYVFRHKSSENLFIDGHEIKTINKWNRLNNLKIFASIICTPTSRHVEQLLKLLDLGSHVLIEKPLFYNKKNLKQLKDLINKSQKYVSVAYMMRFHPLILKIKDIVETKKYGNLISFDTIWGEYLPDWHPWEDYRSSYASNKNLGGGVSLTLSHDIDLVIWLVNSSVYKTKHIKNFRSSLEMDVESGSDILYEFKNGVTGHSHMNYFSKHNQRDYSFIFENATIQFNYYESKVVVKADNKSEIFTSKKFKRNDMFVSELKFFLNKTLNYNVVDSVNSIEESELILDICKKENFKNDE